MSRVVHPILGLHHVTATVNDAQADLSFYRDLLGLRLVKKTVNFDNHNVYHFYYGDERGTPGTIWTTFPYKGWGVPPGQHGMGQITVTSFSIPAGSIQFWKSRLLDQPELTFRDVVTSDGTNAFTVTDPSGLNIQLIEAQEDERTPWTAPEIPSEFAMRGLHSVTLCIQTPGPTVTLMTRVLGFEVVAENDRVTRLAVRGDAPGRRIELTYGAGAPPSRNGLGTVHHVAMAIASPDQQILLRRELVALGYAVTEVLDRQYFKSIYFREPGGVLFEVATVEPGFTVDEPLPALGRGLKLPPWEEPNRQSIESKLPPVT